MSFLDEQEIGCPYCGERITVLIDPTDSDQQYIEDCQVCCRPIDFFVSETEEGGLQVHVQSENE
ncbi:CPXCG motif-containing cysteine-rich protein [Neptunomonas phycophila]|uniref:CPXCG motif-containing cysteine-rich protein n=1 Tax=Neptunomonas phycophila TaxID=1572645 RepID=UPI0023F7AA98|nr:CPXCG motif-containing cysteine-rich protein [Neptunomonas phycophila]